MSEEAKRRRALTLVAGTLTEAHNSIDAAILGAANAIAVMTKVRREHEHTGILGQPELERLSGGLSRLVEVRGSYISAHAGIAELGVRIGFVTKAEGDLIDKPPMPQIGPVREDVAA